MPRTAIWLVVTGMVFLAGCGSNKKDAGKTKKSGKSAGNSKLVIPPATKPKNLPTVSAAELEQMDEGHRRMVMALRDIAMKTADQNLYTGDRSARRLRALVAQLSDKPQKPSVVSMLYSGLAEFELQLGNEAESIKYFKLSLELAQTRPDVTDEQKSELTFRLGVAYLRRAETQNCCQRQNADSCILPLQGEAIHTNKEGSRNAIKCFTEVLQKTKKNSKPYYQSLWLLNLAYMTLGEFPDKVPVEYRIPATAFQSKVAFPKFPNIAASTGIVNFTTSGGAIGDDYDGDGYIDLVVSCWDTAEQLRFFTNNQDGTFAERTKEAGLTGIIGGLNLVQTDYNNDGFVDIYVLRGGWLGKDGKHPNSLLRNNGDGTFTDVTYDAGLADRPLPTQTGVWADFNNDGNIDLYVGNEGSSCQLYMNQGDGKFLDKARTAHVINRAYCKSVAAGDFDGDGLMDIYVSNSDNQNRLYRNLGNTRFVDVAAKCKVTRPMKSFPSWFWDFDNDGHLDIYVTEFSAETDQIAKSLLGLPIDVPLNRLYKGDGKGNFVDVAKSAKLNKPAAPMGSNFGDLDNDGFLDFYLGTGNTDFADLMPNVMYRNRGGKTFEDVTIPGRFGHLQKGHAVVFADFDRDGDQDIFEQMGGALAGDRYYDVMYQNPGFGNHSITIKLVGVKHNRAGVGARIRIVVGDKGKQRSIYKHVNSGGSFGASPLAQSIGLGRNKQIHRLEILWPGTKPQVFTNVPANIRVVIYEGDNRLHRVD